MTGVMYYHLFLIHVIMMLTVLFAMMGSLTDERPFNISDLANNSSKIKADSTCRNYEMNVLIIYKEGTESYKEVVHAYVQSLYVNTHVKAASNTKFYKEDLEKYDLIYPDVSLVAVDNKDDIVEPLIDYVKEGGNLFLEEDLYEIFPKDVLGMKQIEEVNLTSQTFTFPTVPKKYHNLQKLWQMYSVEKRSQPFYNAIRSAYRKLRRSNVPDKTSIYDVDLTKVDLKIHALPSTAVSLVDSNGFTLLSINNYGNGTVLWTINHIPKRATSWEKPFITRLDLGYPDSDAKNFHFGYASINYLMRNTYLDYLAKEKYGFSIQKVFGAYGRPSLSWQNHIDLIKVWKHDEIIHWIDTLKEENQIPTFSVIRGTHTWEAHHGMVILNLNVGNSSDPMFTCLGSDTPYLLSGKWLQKNDFDYIKTTEIIHPFVVDWNEDGKKDLIIGNGDGNVFFYENIGINEKPVFLEKKIIKEGENALNVGSNAAPFVVDWNENGKKDLIIGNGDGNVFLYENIGINEKPVFLEKKIIKTGENALNVGSNAAPFVVDWNENGKKDLIVGNGAGDVFLYENSGTNEEPVFLGKKMIRKSETDKKHWVMVIRNASPFVVDWNEDGKKDIIVGVSARPETYAINSSYLRKDIERNINYALNQSVSVIPHSYIGHNYTPEQEFFELKMHKKAFDDLNIPWTNSTGVNHHAWSVHNVPVWQTLFTEMSFGLMYDFGWETMSEDFYKFYPTSIPYMPYGMPFLFMKNDTDAYPFIVWTPNTVREYTTLNDESGLFVFPSAFDLPVTYYFHPEHAFKYTKTDILSSYLLCFLKYHTVPTKLDLHSGDAYRIIHSFNKLRDKKEYNMMSEEQAAKAMLNMYFTKLEIRINGDELTLIPNTEDVPENVKEYVGTLGVKIELHPEFTSNGVATDSLVYYKPTNRQIYLGVSNDTTVNLNETPVEEFHLVRSNVPFTLNTSPDNYEITVESSGMRQFKVFSRFPLQIKNDDVVFEKKGNFYVVTDFGSSNKTIVLTR